MPKPRSLKASRVRNEPRGLTSLGERLRQRMDDQDTKGWVGGNHETENTRKTNGIQRDGMKPKHRTGARSKRAYLAISGFDYGLGDFHDGRRIRYGVVEYYVERIRGSLTP